MHSKIDVFVNDLFSDMDSFVDAENFVYQYFADGCQFSCYGDSYRGHDGLVEWYDTLKSAYTESFHQIKGTRFEELDGALRVLVEAVWTAGLKNLGGMNKIRYSSRVMMDIREDHGRFIITKYKSVAV